MKILTKWHSYSIEQQISISEMISFFQEDFEKNYSFDGELHDFWECFYVIKGEARVTSNDNIYTLKTGDIIFHKPLTLHKFTITSDHVSTALFFSFNMTGKSASFFEDKVFHLHGYQRDIIAKMLDYAKSCYTELLQSNVDIQPDKDDLYTSSIYLFPSITMPYYLQMITSFLYQLFLSLLNDNIKKTNLLSPGAMLFNNAVAYMKENIALALSVSNIAKSINISDSGLKRLFNNYAGMGIHKYFLLLKLNYATELLKLGYSVSDVAEKMGFSSQAYFSKTYKREFGISPSKIMQNI